MKLVRLILAIVFPPASIFLSYGFSITLVFSILLTLLGWVPGVIHALWALSKYEDQQTGTV